MCPVLAPDNTAAQLKFHCGDSLTEGIYIGCWWQ